MRRREEASDPPSPISTLSRRGRSRQGEGERIDLPISLQADMYQYSNGVSLLLSIPQVVSSAMVCTIIIALSWFFIALLLLN